ncbi:MAG: hypothetical protein AAF063_38215 [Cyanobacteria bacterium J06643_5]
MSNVGVNLHPIDTPRIAEMGFWGIKKPPEALAASGFILDARNET